MKRANTLQENRPRQNAGDEAVPPTSILANCPNIQLIRSPDARGFRLKSETIFPASRASLFEFFSDAFQLETITPPWLRFAVLSQAPIHIAQGTRIDYRLTLHGIPIRWQSRISVWEPPFRFVDEQIRGPYRRWHHEHLFDIVENGTRCRDIVDYEVFGGRLVNALFVRADVQKIFAFRQERLTELFGTPARASGGL